MTELHLTFLDSSMKDTTNIHSLERLRMKTWRSFRNKYPFFLKIGPTVPLYSW